MTQQPRDKGASAVEFALVVPVLFALLMGILAFGYAFHIQSVLSNAARDAVRVVALSDPAGPDAHATAIAAAQPSVQLSSQHIAITPEVCGSPGTSHDNATVTITYPLQLLGGIGDITLTGKGTMRCNG